MRLFILYVVIMLSYYIQAQTTYTIQGVIADSETGEKLSQASVVIEELPHSGTSSNDSGFYALTLPVGTYTMQVSYVGFDKISFSFKLDQNIKHDFNLSSKSSALEDVYVINNRKQENTVFNRSGTEYHQVSQLKNIPVFFGEQNILKTVTLSPGVKSIGDGDGSIYVRGGDQSHNLILLDDATIYNPTHCLGFFSAFNSDAIEDFTLYKGNAPSTYGGRLASVMDVVMRDGNNQKLQVHGGIGVIASRLMIDGPLFQDKGTFMVAARRTYLDLFFPLFSEEMNNTKLNFGDFNVKTSWQLNEDNKVSFSAYYGRDQLQIPEHFGVNWGNKAGTLQWIRKLNHQLNRNTAIIYSDYDYQVNIFVSPHTYSILSGIRNLSLKHEYEYYLSDQTQYVFGYRGNHYGVLPGQIEANETGPVNPIKLQNKYGFEHALYWQCDSRLSSKWLVNFGFRLNTFQLVGPGDFYTYSGGNIIDTVSFKRGKVVKSYSYIEPNVNLSYYMNNTESTKLSYARNSQNLHVVTSSTASLPTDIWLMSGNNIKPEISDQLSIGYYRSMHESMYQFSTEMYYKWMQNQLDLKNAADIRANEHIEDELFVGEGRAYGLELSLKKTKGKLTGWAAYTLSRTELKIPEINAGKWYPARQDATHDVALVGMYAFSDAWTLSGNWVCMTGNAVTFPTGKYEVNGQVEFYYDTRNAHRMPTYHRLDLGITRNFKSKKNFESSLNFSIYNVYGRKNAFTVKFEEDPDDSSRTRSVMTYLFTMVPSITYHFKF